MLFPKLSANWKLAETSNRFLLVSNLILSAGVLVGIGAAVGNHERITITPPSIDKPYTIGWDSASVDYYKSMATYFSGVIGIVGPTTLNYVTGVIDKFADPPLAEGIKAKLRMQAASYEFKNSTSSAWFEGKDAEWEAPTRKVFVPGRLMSVSASKQVTSTPVVYEYIINIVEGRPVIVHFDSYEGDQPHSLAYFADKKRVEADQKRREEAMRESLGNGLMPSAPGQETAK